MGDRMKLDRRQFVRASVIALTVLSVPGPSEVAPGNGV